MTEEPPEAALVARIHAGERAAENELAARFRSGLVLLLRRWTRDGALAEDLTHEALLVVIERLRREPLADPSRLGAFVRGIAHNLMLAGQRRDARRRTVAVGDQIDDFIDAGADPLDVAARAQEAALVRRVIAELPVARDRELLFRFYIADESKARICVELQLDAVHFNRVLHRARERLRALWLESGKGSVR